MVAAATHNTRTAHSTSQHEAHVSACSFQQRLFQGLQRACSACKSAAETIAKGLPDGMQAGMTAGFTTQPSSQLS
jgi:hypothetical protein